MTILNLLKSKKNLIAIGIGLATLGILPLLWFLQTGHFLVWSYSGEGFYFTHPLPHKVLFSFRNGMFIWAPISFVAMFGLIAVWKRNRFAASFAAIFFTLNIYIISSWWTYYYGGGFGHRALSEHHVFTGILLAYLANWVVKKYKTVLWSFSFLLVGLSIFQGYQINLGIIPQDYVNAEMYRLLFLKIDPKYIRECKATLDCRQFGKVIDINYYRPEKFETEPVVYFDIEREFGANVSFIAPPTDAETQLFLEYYYKKKRNIAEVFDDVFLVIEGNNKDNEHIYYQSLPLYDIRSEALNDFKDLLITLQLPKKDIEEFKLYIWNKGHKTFEVADIDVRIQLVKP